MQADALIRDRKKRSDERVRYRIPPVATFSAPNPPDFHGATSYDTPISTEMLKLLQSMNAKLCLVQRYPHLLFPIFSFCSTYDKPTLARPILLTAHIPGALASKTSAFIFPFRPPTSATTGTTEFLLVPFYLWQRSTQLFS